MYNCFKELSTDIVFNVLYIYIFFILFYIMYNIHVVKRFRAHCGFYAIENKLLLLLLLYSRSTILITLDSPTQTKIWMKSSSKYMKSVHN